MAKKRRITPNSKNKASNSNSSGQPEEELDPKSKKFIATLVVVGILVVLLYVILSLATTPDGTLGG